MAGPGNLDNLKELVEPVYQHFDGIVATFHTPTDDGLTYLESRKGAGAIIPLPYSQRHSHSRNTYLWCGPIEEGDWVVQIDVLERLNADFAAGLQGFIRLLELNQFNMVFYFGKPFLFKHHESMEYVGTPHETLLRKDGFGRSIELSNQYPDEKDVRLNVRPEKRDIPNPYAWVTHYSRYMLGPWGSNAALLGLDTYGDPATLFPDRERRRLAFRAEVKRRGHPLTNDGLKALFATPLDQTLKDFVNGEKVWSDFYRHEILGDKTVVHSHDPKDIVKV